MLPPAQKIANARSKDYSTRVRIAQVAAAASDTANDLSQAVRYASDVGQKSVTGNNSWGAISNQLNIDVTEMTVGSVFHLCVGATGNMGSVVCDMWFSVFALGNTSLVAVAKIPKAVAGINQAVDITMDFWFTIKDATHGDFATRAVAQQDAGTNTGATAVGFAASAAIVTTASSGVVAQAAINGSSSGASITSKFSTLDRYVALWPSTVTFAR